MARVEFHLSKALWNSPWRCLITAMMTEQANPPNETTEPLSKAISDRYLQYALSTIMHRALPDARDGLKPVHRRILFAMRELKLSASSGFRKCAKISGDVMGNYHPHGDQAIYDALVRLAQDFNMRYPLVDGQGNFGSIDGDNAAASRYTEARLAAAAEALMAGLSENAVDFRPNYDGTLEEPVVLPAEFPNLLANGSSGIAVGMATNIPPHNIGELCDACLHLLEDPNAGDGTLAKIVPGPDFPTGGTIVEPPDKLEEIYATGRGSIRIRARWSIEQLERGSWQIVVAEIPYQVQKSRLIERIADLVQSKKLPALADIRDESAEDVRIVLEPRSRNIKAELLMESLFRQCDLEAKFAVNMNALIDGRTPRVCSLEELLRAFLAHRKEVLERRSRHRLEKVENRLEVLEGFIVAFLNLDRVIEIIRYEDHPKAVLMKEFDLSDMQAEAILNMRLRSLRKLEELELRQERDDLLRERADIDDLLEDDSLKRKRIGEELEDARRRFGAKSEGGARRTDFGTIRDVGDIPAEALIERVPVTVICSELGWIRSVRGTMQQGQKFKYRDGDRERFVLKAESTDKLVLFGSNGRFYTIPVSTLPGGRGSGEPVRVMIDLPNDADVVALFVHQGDRKLMLASASGFGFVVSEAAVIASTRNGKQVMNVKGADVARICVVADGNHVASVSDDGRLLIVPKDQLPEMSRGKGVRIHSLGESELADLKAFDLEDGLRWLDPAGRTRKVLELDAWIGKRAGRGRKVPRGFPKDNKFT